MNLVCLIVMGVAVAMTAAEKRPTYGFGQILKDERNGYDEYAFQYSSSDGITRQEYGSQSNGQVSKGGWRYTSPEGVPVDITFVADHGGYQPQGAVLPVAPALPYQRYGN